MIPISNGDTLTVKRRLNAEESRRLKALAALPTLAEPGLVMVYLVDWTLVDDAGKLVPIAGVPAMALGNALDALYDEDFDEIYAAVAAHVDAMNAERAAAKKAQGGEKESSAISPSLDAAAGATSGSPN